MATTSVSPNNAKVAFKGKPMAKEKAAATTGAPAAREMAGMEKDYEAEDALRTMTRAEEHAGDKDLMKRVGAHVQKQAASLSKVQAKLEARGLISPKQAEKMAQRKAAN